MTSNKNMPTIFISYKWERSDIAAELGEVATVFMDKRNIPMWNSLKEFMKSIRKKDFAILLTFRRIFEI